MSSPNQEYQDCLEKMDRATRETVEKYFAEIQSQLETTQTTLATTQTRLERFKKTSLERLICDPPGMTLKPNGSAASHTGKSKHTKKVDVNFKTMTLDKIDTTNLENSGLTSTLLSMFNGKEERPYSTEGDVTECICAALNDFIKLVEHVNQKKFYVHHEYSLFSDRPDHLVLFDKDCRDPIMAIEDKKPFINDENKVNDYDEHTDSVKGQVYDYIMEMRAFGSYSPHVVLSTFNESSVFCLEQDHLATSVRQQMETAKTPSNNEGLRKKKLTPSPPQLVEEAIWNQRMNDATKNVSKKQDSVYQGMKMMQSQNFDSKDLVSLLFTTMHKAVRESSGVSSKIIIKPSGEHDGLALGLHRKGYEWGCLKVSKDDDRVEWRGESRSSNRNPRLSSNHNPLFYVTQKLGRGDTSKVFGAYDTNGDYWAIKMYVKQERDGNGSVINTINTRKAKQKRDLPCLREVDRLQEAYGFLKGKVRFEELNNFPCVIMPFFKPLTEKERSDVSEDEDALKGILEEFNFCDEPDQGGQGTKKFFRYGDDDIRWRHVGYYQVNKMRHKKERHLVMFDLADLVEVKGDESAKTDAIDYQIKKLKGRLEQKTKRQAIARTERRVTRESKRQRIS